MKRGKIALMLVAVVFMVSGCGKEKELVCNTSLTQAGITIEQNVNVKMKGNKVEDVNFDMLVLYPDGYTDEQKNVLFETYKNQESTLDMKAENSEKGVKLTAGKDSKYLKDVDFDSKISYDDLKKEYEKKGYTCK